MAIDGIQMVNEWRGFEGNKAIMQFFSKAIRKKRKKTKDKDKKYPTTKRPLPKMQVANAQEQQICGIFPMIASSLMQEAQVCRHDVHLMTVVIAWAYQHQTSVQHQNAVGT